MPRVFTVQQISDRIRERTDKVNDPFLTEPELQRAISSSYARLYTKFVKGMCSYFEKTDSITTNGQPDYPVPDDFAGTLRVDANVGGRWVEIFEIMLHEVPGAEVPGGSQADGWRVVGDGTPGGDRIWIYPPGLPAGQKVRHVYAPAAPDLAVAIPPAALPANNRVDGIWGHDEWIVIDVSIKVLTKEESDTTTLERQLKTLDADVMEEIQLRTAGSPTRMVDVRRGWSDPASRRR